MKLRQTTYQISHLLEQIEKSRLDLHPEFQRGEVWTLAKKRRLVDTILRGWYVPPIHLVQIKGGGLEVLDGQQRLLAIKEFTEGSLRIDGNIHPLSPSIEKLHDQEYSALPSRLRTRFLKFKIRAVTLFEYAPEEPGELFFRLNQLTGLTPAEQRNAFYGTARLQVKAIVSDYSDSLFKPDILGFSNTRMGYDDVVARLCFVLDVGTHYQKVTARAMEEKYRLKEGFQRTATSRATSAVKLFSQSAEVWGNDVRFNKATLFSWLCFVAEAQKDTRSALSSGNLGGFVRDFEARRIAGKVGEHGDTLLLIFNDRASSRVADVTSVLVRDFVLWFYWAAFCRHNHLPLQLDASYLEAIQNLTPTITPPPPDEDFEAEKRLMAAFEKYRWGKRV